MIGVELDYSKLSVVFISFDEDNKIDNLNRLKRCVPDVLHVDGVEGFDHSHRVAGERARSDHVITIDGDNWLVDKSFFKRKVRFRSDELHAVTSYAARVSHNGLEYGNGGLKVWPRALLRSLATHELASERQKGIDFVWRIPYVQARGVPTLTVVTTSPFQAFRAGFREGTRLVMHKGQVAREAFPDLSSNRDLLQHLSRSNAERLRIWCEVSGDEVNGNWAMLGARLGALSCALNERDHHRISNYPEFRSDWEGFVTSLSNEPGALDRCLSEAADRLKLELGLELANESMTVGPIPQRGLGLLLPY